VIEHQTGPGITPPKEGITLAGNATDETVAALERDWPNWQVWVVRRVVGGPVWCARRWDGTGPVLNAHTADELTEYLEDEATG
jgi:hypothetical protein